MFHTLHHLLHPLKVLWRERIELFWPIWISMTAIGALLAIRVASVKESVSPHSIPSGKQDSSRAVILASIFLGIFLAGYVRGSLVWEDFTYSDNSYFTNGTLAGHDIPIQITPELGRFTPLAFQEFNLVRHMTASVVGYHALHIVQLLLLSGILLVLLEELSFPLRVALVALTLITPSIVISFSGLIYLEWNVIFFFACLVWFVKCFEQKHSIACAVGALVSCQCMLYYKETAFLLLLGFAAGRLLFRCWKAEYPGWDFKRLRDDQSRLDLLLAFLAVLFLLYYLAAMFPHFQTTYVEDYRLSLKQALASYLRLDLLAWLLVAVVLVRIVLILCHKLEPSPLWDGLALAGLGCFAGYASLRISSGYYFAPVDLIAVLYLGRLAALSYTKMHFVTKTSVLVLASLVFIQDLSLSAFRMYERKNVIHAKATIGHLIQARYNHDPQTVRTLFFPFANPFHIMEFASYLNYLGVPVEGVPVGSAASNSVEIVAKSIKTDGPCGYRVFECHPGSGPNPGDLVVVLPDDITTSDELSVYRPQNAMPLFLYHPRPSIPEWLRPYINPLHVISTTFMYRQLPDSWLDASVTLWK